MSSLDKRITELESIVKILKAKLKEFSENTEEKEIAPYSKIKAQPKFGNIAMVFDGNEGIFKCYAIYKDDDEEE